MKNIKIIFSFIVLVLLIGCGKKDTQENDKKVVTIMSSTITESPEGDIEQTIADEYMRLHPNVEIKYIGVPINDMGQRITTLATTGNLPDAFFNPPQFQSVAYDMGIIAPINSLLDDEYLKGFSKTAVDNNTINSDLVVFPWYAIPPAIIYRTDWFKELGIETPRNWDEFLSASKKMTRDSNGDGKVDKYGFSMIGTRNGSGEARFIMIARNFGVDDILLKDGKYSSGLFTENYRNALTFFTDLHNKYKVTPPGPTETGYSEAVNYFATEKTGMLLTGSNAIGSIIAQNPNLDGKLGSFPVPSGTRAVNFIPTEGYSVTNTSKNKEIVIDYLKFMSNTKNIVNFSKATGRMPVRIEAAANEVFKDDIYKGFMTAINNPYYPQKFPRYAEVLDAVGESYTTVMATDTSIDKSMETLKVKLDKILKESNE